MDVAWPTEGLRLTAELVTHSDRFGLIVGGDDDAEDLISSFEELLNTQRFSVGTILAADTPPPTVDAVISALEEPPLLVDLEVLFWSPWMPIDVIGSLRRIARRRRREPLLAHWPGSIRGDIARYSEPGRRDSYEASVADVVLLMPRLRLFPDEVPYQVVRL